MHSQDTYAPPLKKGDVKTAVDYVRYIAEQAGLSEDEAATAQDLNDILSGMSEEEVTRVVAMAIMIGGSAVCNTATRGFFPPTRACVAMAEEFMWVMKPEEAIDLAGMEPQGSA